jgi:hypothetical protein
MYSYLQSLCSTSNSFTVILYEHFISCTVLFPLNDAQLLFMVIGEKCLNSVTTAVYDFCNKIYSHLYMFLTDVTLYLQHRSFEEYFCWRKELYTWFLTALPGKCFESRPAPLSPQRFQFIIHSHLSSETIRETGSGLKSRLQLLASVLRV